MGTSVGVATGNGDGGMADGVLSESPESLQAANASASAMTIPVHLSIPRTAYTTGWGLVVGLSGLAIGDGGWLGLLAKCPDQQVRFD